MPFTDEDYRRMGEIADASVVDAMTKLAGLLSNEDFKAKLLDHDNLETDPDFDWKLEDASSHLDYLLDVVESRQAHLCASRGEKGETNVSA